MRITHLSPYDNLGGAARAARRLHQGLLRAGHQSRMVVGWRTLSGPEVSGFIPDASRMDRLTASGWMALDRVTGLQYLYRPWSRRVLRHPAVQSAEAIVLHNVHGGHLALPLLPRLGRIAPLVWAIGDLWPLTGHCAFPVTCERWKQGCGRCPDLQGDPGIAVDTTAWLWRLKQRLYRRMAPVIVTPSRWLADRIGESPLLGWCQVRTIPYGLDTEVFRPLAKPAARQALGLPLDADVILFAAYSARDPRKGAALAAQALRMAAAGRRKKDLWLVTVGRDAEGQPEWDLPIPVRHLGPVVDEQLLTACYSAADVLLAPSQAESFGQVYSEAMACGTPCIALRTTAVPEVVRHLETGYLADPDDSESLLRGLRWLLDDEPRRQRLGVAAREVAKREYALETQVRRYHALLQELTECQDAARVPQPIHEPLTV